MAKKAKKKPMTAAERFNLKRFMQDVGEATVASRAPGGLNLDIDAVHRAKDHTPWNDPDTSQPPFQLAFDNGINHPIPQGINHDSTHAEEIAKRPSVVQEMADQRHAIKRQVNQESPYPWRTADAAKLRVCLSECAAVVAEAVVRAAKIIAGKDAENEPDPPDVTTWGFPAYVWQDVGPDTPYNTWVETAAPTTGGSKIVNAKRIATLGGDKWLTNESGPVRIYAPTHWRWPTNQEK